MIVLLKKWYAKKNGNQRRQLVWLASGVFVLVTALAIAVARYRNIVTESSPDGYSAKAEGLDLPSLLFFGGAILALFVIIWFLPSSERGANWEETGRRNQMASKHPWARKQDR